MISNGSRPDHNRCSPRMCRPCHAQHMPEVRQTSPLGREIGAPRLNDSHPAVTTASPTLSTDLVSRGSLSLDAQARC